VGLNPLSIRHDNPSRVAALGHLSSKRRWRGIPTWMAEFLRDYPRGVERSANDLLEQVKVEGRRRDEERYKRGYYVRGMTTERFICLLRDMGFVKREVNARNNVWSKPPLRTASDETEA
jgi:hypothetical protein